MSEDEEKRQDEELTESEENAEQDEVQTEGEEAADAEAEEGTEESEEAADAEAEEGAEEGEEAADGESEEGTEEGTEEGEEQPQEPVESVEERNRKAMEILAEHRPYYMEEKITFADIQSHLSGPLISIVIHAILIFVLGTAILFDPPPKEKEDVVVEMQNVEIEPVPPPPPPEREPQETEIVESTFQDVPMDRPAVQQEQFTQAVSEPVATASTDFASDDLFTDNVMPTVDTNKSKLKLTGAFANRAPAGRLRALKAYGGGQNTERSVDRALLWLVKVQNEDGSWGDMDDQYNQKVQLTCLSLLAFLAHGETPQSENYGEALMKGLKKVLEWADKGRHESGVDEAGKPKWQNNDSYATARIAIVLAEGYAITKIPSLERGMNQAVDWIIKRQNVEGGFGEYRDPKTGEMIYGFSLDEGSRLYNALYCAYHAGCEHPGMKQSIERSINAMEKYLALPVKKGKGGGFIKGRNAPAGAKHAEGKADFEATGAGTLYLYLMGSNGKQAKRGYKWLCEFQPNDVDKSQLKMDWKNLPSQTSALGWYYMTQALFQGSSGKGEEWKKWNRSVIATLCREQNQTAEGGYWQCPADKYQHFDIKRVNKSTNPKKPKWVEEKVEKIYNESSMGGFTELNGKLWATVYFTLALEVYYRYLPTFQTDGKRTRMDLNEGEGESESNAKEEEKKADADDDISLD